MKTLQDCDALGGVYREGAGRLLMERPVKAGTGDASYQTEPRFLSQNKLTAKSSYLWYTTFTAEGIPSQIMKTDNEQFPH